MNIQLGNLKLKDIVKEQYIKQIQNFLDENGFHHTATCENVDSKEGNYHIYDIPRHIHICGEEKAYQFVKFLQENNLVDRAFIGIIGILPLPISNNQSESEDV